MREVLFIHLISIPSFILHVADSCCQNKRLVSFYDPTVIGTNGVNICSPFAVLVMSLGSATGVSRMVVGVKVNGAHDCLVS